MKEFFEPIFRNLRIKEISKRIKRNGILCDIGCGKYPFFLIKISKFIKKGIGIDKKVNTNYKLPKNIFVKKFYLNNEITLKSNYCDNITLLAVLEHLEKPCEILKESKRILKKSGKLLITIPSIYSKYPLNLLALLNLISREEIKDHKNYFSKKQIIELLKEVGFRNIKILYYNLFFNMLIICEK